MKKPKPIANPPNRYCSKCEATRMHYRAGLHIVCSNCKKKRVVVETRQRRT